MADINSFDGIPVSRRRALLTMGALGLLACDGGQPRERATAISPRFQPRDRLGRFLVDHMESYGIPGMTVWVARGAETRTYAVGQNDIDFDIPVTDDTPYQIASVSKIFAGIALMLLVDKGTLDVDARLPEVLPDVPAAWGEIRVHHLLEHTSGLPRSDAGAPGFDEEAQRRRRREIFVDDLKLDHFTADERLAYLKAQPLAGVPGAAYSYNQMGYLVAGVIVERLSGSPYPAFLAERVFEPLGMRTARFGDSRVLVPGRRQAAYTRQYGQMQNWIWPFQTSDYPAAGLNISAPDLGRCIAALADGRLLSEAARDRMWTRARLNDGTTVDYGLGWTIGELRGETVVGHEGGGCCWLLRAPRSGVSVVALSNLAGSGADATAEQIASLVMDE